MPLSRSSAHGLARFGLTGFELRLNSDAPILDQTYDEKTTTGFAFSLKGDGGEDRV